MKYIRQKRKWIGLLWLISVLWLGGCSMQGREKVTYADTAMGTIVQQTLYVKSKAGEDAESAVPGEIMSLLNALENDTLSWRAEDSEIYQINTVKPPEGCLLSEDMKGYLEIIGDVWEKSDGALDITVGGVTRLWNIDGFARTDVEFQLPEEREIRKALENTGFEKIKAENGKIYMPENVALDLGAVGKGIACDKVRALLKEKEQVSGAVISVGGSVLTYGEKPDGSGWKVAIKHPRKSGETMAVLQLKGSFCVSTSGDYERYVEKDGVRYHHIIDPETGYPADSGIISVTIVSESGILSDALSTACFIMGKEAGLALAREYGAQAYIIDKDLNVYMTEGMDKLLILE